MTQSVGGGIFSFDVTGADKFRAFTMGLSNNVRDELRKTVNKMARDLQTKIKTDYLNLPAPGPDGLHHESGTLGRSININQTESDAEIRASVGTNIFYGVAWELGNVKNWQKHTQPARKFLQPAYVDLQASISVALQKAVGIAVKMGAAHGSRP